MKLFSIAMLVGLAGCSHEPVGSTSSLAQRSWIVRSDELATEFTIALSALHPEVGSQLGYSKFDQLGLLMDGQTEERDRQFFVNWNKKLNHILSETQDLELKTDIQILQNWVKNEFEQIEVSQHAHEVEFFPATLKIYKNLQILLNPQSPPDRKAAAVDRFKVYVHGDQHHKPLLEAYQEFDLAQITKFQRQASFFPFQGEVEQYLKDSSSYRDGIKELLQSSGRADWDADFAEFARQVKSYDHFVKNKVLRKARKDPRLLPAMYAQILKKRELNVTPERLIEIGEVGYKDLYEKFRYQSLLVSRKYSLSENDPASVIKFLKSKPVTSASAAEQLYREADARLNVIMKSNNLISIPDTPLKIRVAGEAESKAAPVPHLIPPPLVGNKGIRPEFVVPSVASGLPFDDFSSRFPAIILTAHEGRPGHDMQYSQMLDHGVSIIRSRYAANSVNIEGWALYAEDLVYPYLEPEEQLFALQTRLWRMARTFLDPQIQLGKIKGARVIELYTKELGVSPAMANLELRRYTFDDVGQAPSYYFGYLQVKQMRIEAEKRLGRHFNLKCFNDQLLSYGLLPLQITAERIKSDLKCTSI